MDTMMITLKLFHTRSLSPPWRWPGLPQQPGKLLIIHLLLINFFLPYVVATSVQDSIPSMSNPPQDHRVFITSSYSSTNFKSGPVSQRRNSSHIANPNRRHSSVSPVNNNYNFRNSKNRVVSNSFSDIKKSLKIRPRQVALIHNPILSKSSSSVQKKNSNDTTTMKPTMHPLRVLQTEISLPTKSLQRAKHQPKQLIFISPQQENLSNHRIRVDKAAPSISNKSKSAFQPLTNLSSDVRAQLELINQRTTRSRITPNEVLTMRDNKTMSALEMQPGVVNGEGRSDLSAIFSGESTDQPGTVEGRSASEKSKAKKSKTAVEESKQLRSQGPFSYMNTLTDQIAEEDHQYEVTELVNQYPAEYENQDQATDLTTKNAQIPLHSGEFQSQIQNPNHNYHNSKQRGEKTRPKLNSYYDQNYHHLGPATNHDSHNDNKKHESKNQAQNDFHYHANSNDHGNFHGNHNFESHYAKPGFGPYWHQPLHHPPHLHRPEPPPGHEKFPNQHQHFSSSPPKSNHPPPQPYNGEHDLQTASTDTIMDRFEVFYKEYKILTWAALFIVTSLGFLTILVYMYINNPPTEVVTARSKITEYLSDPGLLKFLSNILEPREGGVRKRKKKVNETKEL